MRYAAAGALLLTAALTPSAAGAVNMSIEEVTFGPGANFNGCLERGAEAIRTAGLRPLPPGTRSRGGENDARDQLYVVYCTSTGSAVVIGSGPQDANVGPMVSQVVGALRGGGQPTAPRPPGSGSSKF